MLKFRCPHCDQKIGLPQQYAGKQVRCAKCRQTIVVPSASEETNVTDKGVIRFRCSGCEQKLRVSQIYAGKKLKCPKCSALIVVPQLTDVPAIGSSSTGSTISDEMFESNAVSGDLHTGIEQVRKTPPPLPKEDSLQFQPVDTGTGGSVRYPSCGALHSPGRKFCTLCGKSLTDDAGDISGPADSKGEVTSETSEGKGSIVLGILASIAFAVVGGVIWCIAAKFIGMGWMSFMAVMVCCLAGAGFYLCTQNRSVGVGILAAIIGFVGILNGKTLIAKYVATPQVKNFMSDTGGQLGLAFEGSPMEEKFYEDMVKDDDLMFTVAAMQLAEEGLIEEELLDDILAEQRAVEPNQEKSQRIEQAKTEVKTAIGGWSETKKKEVVRAQLPKMNKKYVDSFIQSEVGKTFTSIGAWLWSFSCQDFVWFPLGMFCAYKVARGDD